jgi:DNA-binding LacI/PurR family transcriptional regulator
VTDPPRPSATLEDVARVAGVSRSTVSRVINGSRNFDPAVREAVRAAVAQTGYVPSIAARSLASRRAGAIALVLSGIGETVGDDQGQRDGSYDGELFADPFFGRIANGVTRFLRPRGVHPTLMFAETPADREHVVAYLRRGNADGALLVSTHPHDPLPELLVDAGLAAVLFARPARMLPISYVDLAHRDGAALAAAHLLARGCTRVATISGPLDVAAAQDRLSGFREAMARQGHGYVPSAEGDFTLAGGEKAMDLLLAQHPDLDGVFVANDVMAQGALLTLRERGRRVPADVAVVGFDDSRAATGCRPKLTTVRQPVEDMAAQMTRMLLEQIDRPERPPASVIFDPRLVVRESA